MGRSAHGVARRQTLSTIAAGELRRLAAARRSFQVIALALQPNPEVSVVGLGLLHLLLQFEVLDLADALAAADQNPDGEFTAAAYFVAGKFDLTFPNEITVPLLADLKTQAPWAVCTMDSMLMP